MRPSAGEAYSDLIASGPAHRSATGYGWVDAKGVAGPAGAGKDVTDCCRVRTTFLETRHAHTRRSGHLIGTATSMTMTRTAGGVERTHMGAHCLVVRERLAAS